MAKRKKTRTKKKDNKLIWILVGIVAIYLLTSKMPPGITTTTSDAQVPVDIKFYVRDGNKDVLVEGTEVPDPATGSFDVGISNQKGVTIQDVEFTGQSDDTALFCETGATDEFDDPASYLDGQAPPWTVAASCATGGDCGLSPYSTAAFDLDCYAPDIANEAGDVTFSFNFQYDWVDPDSAGSLIPNVPVTGAAIIEFFYDKCTGEQALGTCGGDGLLCTYVQGSGAEFIEDEVCCLSAGGTWGGASCSFGCSGYGLSDGECLQSQPVANEAIRATYCAGTNMVENCGVSCSNGNPATCWDYYGNPQASCDGATCVFETYEGGVISTLSGFDLGGCEYCNDWTLNACGDGSCTTIQEQLTRTCFPDDPVCTPADGYGYEQCLENQVTCCDVPCNAWTNDVCAGGTCAADEMRQTRTGCPGGCATERCVVDPQCAEVLLEGYNTGQDTQQYVRENFWSAQSFTLSAAGDVTKVKLWLDADGSLPTEDVYVGIRATDGADKPTGPDLGLSTIAASTIVVDEVGTWYEFDFSPPVSLSGSTLYAIVLRLPDGSGSDRINVWYDDGDASYAGGMRLVSTSSGSTWNAPIASDDIVFEVWGS